MKIKVYLSKRTDMDLISMIYAGHKVSRLMKNSIISFAHNQNYRIVPDIKYSTIKDKNSANVDFVISDKDEKTISIIKSLKPRCRSAFCKSILRNALVQQNVSIYFKDESCFDIIKENQETHMHLTSLMDLDENIVEEIAQSVKTQKTEHKQSVNDRIDTNKNKTGNNHEETVPDEYLSKEESAQMLNIFGALCN